MINGLQKTPWDKRTFQIDTYELQNTDESTLQQTDEIEGHFTVKVDPLADQQKLYDYGFYYVDSLIEPRCRKRDLRTFPHQEVQLASSFNREKILEIAESTFEHGRFHRDFNVPNRLADERYMRWVQDLIDEKCIYALLYEEKEVGFYGFKHDSVLLLSIHPDYQGFRLAKPFTSLCVEKQFGIGYEELKTSISAANVKSLNLFLQLGFTLRKTLDVYHKLQGVSLKDV